MISIFFFNGVNSILFRYAQPKRKHFYLTIRLVYWNSSECCLGEAGECCYDENKKGRLKELKMTHGAYVKQENAVMTRNVYNNGNAHLMTC